MSTTGTTHHPVTSDVDDTTWASDPLTPPGGGAWDFLIVGGGTAGLVAAHTAAGFGASTLLVERARTGGDCLWTGCVPSKALLAAAHVVGEARAASALGVHVGDITVDFDEVMAHVRSTITAIEPVDSPAALRAAGAKVAQGSVLFTGPQSATVDGTPITFTQALVATGSEPLVPGLPGLADVDPLTSDNVWALTELPERLLVLGGGPIGCELGQAFSRLGSSVTIVEAADRLISGETPPASDAIARAFENDGIDVRTGVTLTSIEPDRAGGPVALLDDGSEVPFDRILVSVGRRPRTSDLGLGAAGVALQQSGHIDVDNRLRTSNPRIWAAGDLTGHAPFTHTAGSHGSLAASNAVLGLRRTVQPDLVPRVTYTSPEVASFGIAADSRPGLIVHTVPHSEVDRARAEGQVHGYSQLVLDAKGKVVGASIVGPRAGESLAEALLAGQQGLKARAVAGAMHAYPTWSDGVWKAALAQGRADLESTPVKQVTAGLATVRRAWLKRRTHTA
ncbi:dihydrolipoyl dehydrogenase family protein [Nocardioides sp.]|uniref:dihydrolipoyl dehydrogenase family protein n=1 Tax=Nocardioides sp. TaxID=35761 RepID=UPI002B27908F|nr:FAD-dependent oxidoreductase [Nocardioides sp.]